jgi:hypothetical protein
MSMSLNGRGGDVADVGDEMTSAELVDSRRLPNPIPRFFELTDSAGGSFESSCCTIPLAWSSSSSGSTYDRSLWGDISASWGGGDMHSRDEAMLGLERARENVECEGDEGPSLSLSLRNIDDRNGIV